MRYAFRAVGGHDKNHNVITAAEPGAAPDRLQRPLLRRFRFRRRVSFGVCARHGTERARCKSSCQVFAEPKARRRARASTVRWGLEEAQSKRAGRRTGTGYEVWCTRDERARDCEVLHPQGVHFINPASMRGPRCVLPWEICRLSRSKGTEGGAIRSDRSAEVSRGHSRLDAGNAREAPQGRQAGQQRGRAATRVG
jgi:hypothetical protein